MHISNTFQLHSWHPLLSLPSLSALSIPTSLFPGSWLLVWFCDSFSLPSDFHVSIGLEAPIGSRGWGGGVHQWLHNQRQRFLLSLNLLAANSSVVRGGPIVSFFSPFLSVDRPIFVTHCSHPQLFWVSDCNDCVLPRSWQFTALLHISQLLHSFNSLFRNIP